MTNAQALAAISKYVSASILAMPPDFETVLDAVTDQPVHDCLLDHLIDMAEAQKAILELTNPSLAKKVAPSTRVSASKSELADPADALPATGRNYRRTRARH